VFTDLVFTPFAHIYIYIYIIRCSRLREEEGLPLRHNAATRDGAREAFSEEEETVVVILLSPLKKQTTF